MKLSGNTIQDTFPPAANNDSIAGSNKALSKSQPDSCAAACAHTLSNRSFPA